MTAGEARGGIFHGWWFSILMLYFLMFTGGFGLYGFPMFVERFETALGRPRVPRL